MYTVEKDKDIYTDDEIGKKLITSALNMDDKLAELLAVEIRRAKKLLNKEMDLESFSNLANLLKNIIMAMTLTENRIRDGIDLCFAEKPVKEPEKEPPRYHRLTTL